MFESVDRAFMKKAIEEMRKCPDIPHRAKVGCVAVFSGNVVATGFKGQVGKHSHAEKVVLGELEAKKIDSKKCTLYSTMEPCFGTKAGCSEAIVAARIPEVVIGAFDINPSIKRKGYKYLGSKGIKLRGFDSDLSSEINELNNQFNDNFQRSVGPVNHCSFPYKENQNKQRLELVFSDDDSRKISVRCSSRDHHSVYLYADAPTFVAKTGEVFDFDELDDSLLALFDFDYAAEIKENEIAVFKSPDGFALVKITKIDRNNPVVHVRFEIRAFTKKS